MLFSILMYLDESDGIAVAEDMAEMAHMAERPREAWTQFGIISNCLMASSFLLFSFPFLLKT